MSRIDWTPEQRRVLEEVGRNVLLSAAAGSGKTAVLTEFCFRLMCGPKGCDPGRLMVSTFTEAAAAEMKKRIYNAVDAAVREDPSLRRLRLELDRMQVGTLHSFCLRVLHEYFDAAGLDPGIEVMAQTETETLFERTREAVLESLYADGHAGFLNLVSAYEEACVTDTLTRLCRVWAASPDPEAWRQEVRAAYASATRGEATHPWHEAQSVPATTRLTRLAREEQRLRGSTNGFEKILDLDGALLEGFTETLDDEGWDAFVLVVRGAERERFRGKGEPSDKARVQAWHDEIGKCVKAWGQGDGGLPLFTLKEMARDAADLLPQLDAFFECAMRLDDAYRAAKTQRARLDFADLERHALRLLGSDAIAREVSERWDHVLVDEYQDINPLQDAILARVSRAAVVHYPGNLFMVGDVKQSIFGFRQADCGIFLEKLSRFSAGGARDVRLDLSSNFRSRPEVLSAVNAVCQVWMDPCTGCPPYDDRARLNTGASYPEPPPDTKNFAGAPARLHLFERAKPEDPDSKLEEEADSILREAAGTAQLVASLLSSGHSVVDSDTKQYRPLRASDIVILLRSASRRAAAFMEALLVRGIAVEGPAEPGGGVAFERADMDAMLRVLDNPRQDIPLAAVLRSPFVRLSDEALLRLRMQSPRGDLLDALDPLVLAGEDRQRLQLFLADLERRRALVPRLCVLDLLLLLFRETGYLEYVCATRGGRRRRAHLVQLLEHARQFDAGTERGLHRFLEFVETAQKESESTPPEHEGDIDAVRIMTIHRSKGLEFPVVIVADLGKGFNMRDTYSPVIVDARPVVGLTCVDDGVRYPTLAHAQAREVVARRMREEELRLLYVAMTRAREHLILCAGVEKLDEVLGKASGPIDRVACLERWDDSRSALDWLLPLVPPGEGDAWNTPDGALRVTVERETVQVRPRRRRESAPRDAAWWEAQLASATPAPVQPASSGEALSRLPAKMGVSELKRRRAMQNEEGERSTELFRPALPRRPRFLREGAAPTELGTAVHAVFQHWNRACGPEDVAGEITRMVQAGVLSSREAERVDGSMIRRFLLTELGARFLDPDWRLQRELPFSLAVPASEIEPAAGEDFVLVQGVIDALLTRGEEALVLDFKTDAVAGVDIATRREFYRPQLDWYCRAVEEGYGYAKPQAWIAFLVPGATERLAPVP